jgi:hypothetical protein
VKRFPAPIEAQFSAKRSGLQLDAPVFQAGSLFAAPWQTSVIGLVGAFSCASCHAEKVHVVRKIEQLGYIAQQYNLRGHDSLYRCNIKTIGDDPDYILPGQVLLIPREFYWASTTSPSRTSGFIGKSKPAVVSFANCVVCHGQVARAAGKSDCLVCHDSQHVVTAATAQAKRLVTTRRAARSPKRIDGIAQWDKENVDPFGEKRDPIKAISILPSDKVDDELKSMLVESYNQPSVPFMLMPGQDIDFLLSGDYKWLATARWVGAYPLPGEAWPVVTYNGRSMRLVRTFACYNLEIIPVKLPAAPGRPKIDEPPPTDNVGKTPTPPTSPPDNVITAMPPPVSETKTPTKIPLPLPKIGEPKFSCDWDPDFEWPVYGGFSRGIHGDSLLRYEGTVFTFYPAACKKEERMYRIGAQISAARWDLTKDQRSGGSFQLEGHNEMAGVKGEYIDPERKIEVETRFGTQKYEYWNSTNPKDRTISDKQRMFFGITGSHYGFEDNSAVTLLQWGISTEQDLGGTVSKGQNVNESIYTLRGRVEGKQYGDKYTPILDLPVDYSQGQKIFGAHPAVGVKYRTFAEFLVGISANLNNGTGDNTRGVKTIDGKASVDLDRLFKFLLDPESYGKGSDYEPPPLTDGEE